jgi:hypothetical protein
METGRIVHADLLEWDTAALPISDLAGRKDSLVWRRRIFFFLQYAAVEFIMQKLRLSMLHAG